MEALSLNINVEGVVLQGEVYFPTPGDKESRLPGLVLCHGVPRGVHTPEEAARDSEGGYALLARRFAEEGFLTMRFNFRGTGSSEGNFDLWMWAEDLRRALDVFSARPELDMQRLYLLGFSGGAAVSVWVSARDPRVKAVALGASPASFEELFPPYRLDSIIEWARRVGIFRHQGFPPDPHSWLTALHRIRPVDRIGELSPRPLLILHGEDDERVPLEHARKLYEQAGEPKEMVIIPEGKHQLRVDERAVAEIMDWLRRLEEESLKG